MLYSIQSAGKPTSEITMMWLGFILGLHLLCQNNSQLILFSPEPLAHVNTMLQLVKQITAAEAVIIFITTIHKLSAVFMHRK